MRRLSALLAAVAVVVALLSLAHWFFILSICYSPVPWNDMWDFWAWSQKYGHDVLWHLAQQHNEHRIALARLFFLFDQYAFAGTAKSLAVLIPTLQAAHAALLSFALFAGSKAHRPLDPAPNKGTNTRRATCWFLTAIIFTALFSPQQFANFTWYFQIQFITVYFCASLSCFALLLLARAERAPTGSPYRPSLWLSVVILCAIATTYSMANGLLIWPILLSLAWFLRLKLRSRVIILLASIALWFAYLFHYTHNPSFPSPLTAVYHPISFLRFFFLTLAAPFADLSPAWRGRPTLGLLLLGVLALLAFCFLAWHTLRPPRPETEPKTAVEYAFLHIGAYALFSIVLIAAGRYSYPIEEALTARYTTASILFWITLFVLLILQLEQRRYLKTSLLVRSLALAAELCILVVNNPGHLTYAHSYQQYLREIEISMANNVYDAPIWSHANHPPSSLEQGTDYLRAHRLAMFDKPWLPWQGDDLLRHFQTVSASSCSGVTDRAVPIPSIRPGYRLEGWARSATRNPNGMILILTDAQNHILGFGMTGYSRPDVAKAIHNPDAQYAGWLAYLRGVSSGTCRVYLLLAHQSTACEIGSINLPPMNPPASPPKP